MSYPSSAPWTQIGSIQSDISGIEQKLYGKADKYELNEVISRLGRLEHSIRELESENSSLRFELRRVQEGRIE